MRRSAAAAVRVIHHAVVLFVLLAWLAPLPEVWLTHVIFLPLMVVQWIANRGMCLLSNLEHLLLGNGFYPTAGESGFIRSVLAKFFDPLPREELVNLGMYCVLAAVWSCSLLRLSGNF